MGSTSVAIAPAIDGARLPSIDGIFKHCRRAAPEPRTDPRTRGPTRIMQELGNPFYLLAGIVLAGFVFLIFVAGRRKKTPDGKATPVAPGSKETPLSGVVTDPKRHKS